MQPPEASWGNILYYAQSISVLFYKALYVGPGRRCMLVLTVLSINFIGDGIRDALDTEYADLSYIIFMSAGKWVQKDSERTLSAKEEKHEKKVTF